MFDIGWTELLVIAVVLIVVVGPKDLPPMLRAFGKMTQRARKVAGEFRAQFDEALREADLDDVRQTLADAQKLNPVNSLRDAMNPLRQMGNEIKADLQKATTVEKKTEVPAAAVSVPEPSMSLPETPPVVAPPPAAVSEPVVAATSPVTATVQEKPKAVRKPRAKAEPATVAAPIEKPKRASTKPATVKKTAAVAATAAPKKTAAKKKKDDA
ncbi:MULTISPECIES: Sec-independent protein translocase protein TatB [unclassified Rhizobium]|uniref:Sec-independent protein translocase protein TatB n=1 Tax=unclassified Rhizobium TaxID=2613769 RepID=UPI0016076731|nr:MULTISPECIES: Sec-independent protein translocase protein TatB [unclassified Rhizobium]MBB3543592.1 sec-independent protein translocase protein TatB [Rhizobium sp. BK399]MCS3741832.1 sec-independent protein translocase protein TatB [Rhizobium sp. BK661]MCS4095411.1 sec-independent protein translocase protein TatB [Rhizobium sp. BK176]